MTIRVFGGRSYNEDPITLIDSQSVINNITQNTIEIPAPLSTTGDYLIAYVYTADSGANPSTGDWNAPANWTRLYKGSKLPNLEIYYKVASGEPSSYTFTFQRSNFYLGGFILSYRNVVDIGFIGSESISTGSYTTQTAPAGSADYTKSFVLAAYFNTNDGLTINLPAGYDSVLSSSGSGGFIGTLALGGSGTTVTFTVGSKTASTFDIASATATLSGTSSDNAESAHLYLIDKTKITTLSANSYNFGTVATNSSTEVPTPIQILNAPTSPDNLITPPAGISFAVGTGSPVTYGAFINTSTTATYTTQNRTIAENNFVKFRLDSIAVGSVSDISKSYDVTVGTRKYTISFDTNSYAIYTTPGFYTFTVPPGVTSLSVMTIGAGGGGCGTRIVENGQGGGGGGACSYSNNYTIGITAGAVLSVNVGASGQGGTLASPAGTNGGDSNVKLGGTTIVAAKGGLGKSAAGLAGAAGGAAASGVGQYRGSGGAGATGQNVYLGGDSGGGGGAAANTTTAANGGTANTGNYYLTQNGYLTGGQGGAGVALLTTGWSMLPSAWTSGYNGGNGKSYGGGGGSALSTTSSTPYSNGGDGGPGAVVIIWNGRTFKHTASY